jgi:hypothetical protein
MGPQRAPGASANLLQPASEPATSLRLWLLFLLPVVSIRFGHENCYTQGLAIAIGITCPQGFSTLQIVLGHTEAVLSLSSARADFSDGGDWDCKYVVPYQFRSSSP